MADIANLYCVTKEGKAYPAMVSEASGEKAITELFNRLTSVVGDGGRIVYNFHRLEDSQVQFSWNGKSFVKVPR